MAELSAAVAIGTALLKLSQFLREQGNFLFCIRDKIERLKRELSWMQSFLKDAENKLDDSNLIQKWVSDVRDLAYDCEDVIDTFLLKLRGPQTQPGRTGVMSRCFVTYTAKFTSTYVLGRQIEKLMEKVRDISSMRERYGLLASDVRTTRDSSKWEKLMEIRRTAAYANNEHMVGLVETVSLLKGKLTNGGSGRFVMSILGMGGLGKTTLARKLYNDLRQEFESHAWVCVSQEYKTRDILLQLIKSMASPTKEDLERITTEAASMEEYLRKCLSNRRFLVLMDDVWEREAWESLERAFPDSNKNSRVIITTRKRQVASLNCAYVHELRYLQEDESWELFCQKAFPDETEMTCPPNLEQLGKEMVAKCSGLPLAIITLGGLLFTKLPVIGEWEMVRDNLWKELEKNSSHINPVLLLSYKDLPQYLKPCFLYVGMFPEDFKIPISKLMSLWLAEGFIGDEEGCPENLAKTYYTELVGRSLIQDKGEDWLGSTCRVHDLLRDIATEKAKEMCFSLYYDGNTTSELSNAPSHRRLAYMSRGIIPSSYINHGIIPSSYINPSLRTLRARSYDWYPNRHLSASPEKLPLIPEYFSLLRVLDIQCWGYSGPEVTKIPIEIGSLIHLRYLGLDLPLQRKVELPETISNLKALETLSVQSIGRVTLPKTMVKLKNLKHLIREFDAPVNLIGRLTGLETLEGISFEQWYGVDTTNLVNLRHLCLTGIPRHEAIPTRFYDKFRNLSKLRTLTLGNLVDFGFGSICASEIFKHCPSVTHFSSFRISYDNSADLHEYALNLQVLEIYFPRELQSLMSSIEKLPRLRALRITMYGGSFGTKQVVCSDGGFSQLRTLKIILIGCEFVVRDGGLPALTHLKVNKPNRFIASDRLKKLINKAS